MPVFDSVAIFFPSSAAVFVVTFLLMGVNLWAALIVMLVVCMIILHMLGCMAVSNINANAVSLVNLVMVSEETSRQ